MTQAELDDFREAMEAARVAGRARHETLMRCVDFLVEMARDAEPEAAEVLLKAAMKMLD